MKRPFFLLASLMILGACTQNKSPSDDAVMDTAFMESEATLVSDTLCFQRYSGLTNQDTTSIKMILDGHKVTGQYSNFPHEKDGRFGTIAGIKQGASIKGILHYQQEGRNDSVGFEFKLQNSRLVQKETSFDRNTGREFLSDTSSFNLEYLQVDCKTGHFPSVRN